MTDTATPAGAPSQAVPPNCYNPPIVGASWPPGTPMTNATGGAAGARANAAGTSQFTGLLRGAGVEGDRALCQFMGPMQLTNAEWNAVVDGGAPTGLTAGSAYYLSAASQGKITATKPLSTNLVVPVGWALSSEVMFITPTFPIVGAGG